MHDSSSAEAHSFHDIGSSEELLLRSFRRFVLLDGDCLIIILSTSRGKEIE